MGSFHKWFSLCTHIDILLLGITLQIKGPVKLSSDSIAF